MMNIRRPLEFRYYSRGQTCSGTYTLIGKSVTIEPKNIEEPVHIHLAFTDRIDQMFVNYLTNSSQTLPSCQYGLDPSALTSTKTGTSITYKASDMCEEIATITGPHNFIDPGVIHTVVMEDLRPSTTYYYRVGNDVDGWSSIYSFLTRPVDEDATVNIVAYGDMGATPAAQETINYVAARIATMNITGLVHIGDISYARGIAVIWEAFMTQIQSVAARVPYMVSIGNHEYDHLTGGEKDPSGAPAPGGFRPSWGNYGRDSGGECAVPMVRRFRSPSNGNGIFWYSFEIGPVHILLFSAEHDFQPSSVQYNWIERDLKSVNRTRTPWIIVGSHRQMFTSENDHPDIIVGQHLQLYLEPLFYQYHVDVNLFAHLHAYERSCPMYQQKCVANGITNVLIGMAGIGLDSRTYSVNEWSQYHDQQYGYTIITANRTALAFKYYHNTDNNVADQFLLSK